MSATTKKDDYYYFTKDEHITAAPDTNHTVNTGFDRSKLSPASQAKLEHVILNKLSLAAATTSSSLLSSSSSSSHFQKQLSETRSNRSSINSKATNSSDLPMSSASSITTSTSFLHINHTGNHQQAVASPHHTRYTGSRSQQRPDSKDTGSGGSGSGATTSNRKHFVSSINISINQSSDGETTSRAASRGSEIKRVKNEIKFNNNLSKVITVDLDELEEARVDGGGRVRNHQNRSSYIAAAAAAATTSIANYDSMCNSNSGLSSTTANSSKQAASIASKSGSAFKVYDAKQPKILTPRTNEYESTEDLTETTISFFIKPPPNYADESLVNRTNHNTG
jgi:hypothetical protein